MAIFDNNPLYENISSLTNPITSGVSGLLDGFSGMNVFGAKPSEALTGILTKEQQDKLRNQSLLQGLIGTAATYLAQPKNQNYGSALPYLAKAYLGGMQSSQGAYDQALAGKIKQQELEQGARKLEMEGLTTPEKLARRIEILKKNNPNDPLIPKLERSLDYESGLRGFGTGVEGTSLNILARGSEKTPQGEAIRKSTDYALAYRNQTTPKYVDQVRMDENGNEYYVRVQLPATKLPSNILPPIYGEEGVTTQPLDMTQPQITTKPGQVAQPTAAQASATTTVSPNIKKFGQTKQDIFKQEQETRKDYMATPEVKNFGEVRSAYNMIDVGLKEKSPAGDLTAATKFMKLLDPTSVVRETELILAMEATGVVDRAKNYFKRLESGEKLTPSQREDFRNVAKQLYKAAESVKLKYDNQYIEIAKSNNLDPSKIVMDYKDNKPSPQIRNKADILKSYGVE
jgi:hypothetical protein